MEFPKAPTFILRRYIHVSNSAGQSIVVDPSDEYIKSVDFGVLYYGGVLEKVSIDFSKRAIRGSSKVSYVVRGNIEKIRGDSSWYDEFLIEAVIYQED